MESADVLIEVVCIPPVLNEERRTSAGKSVWTRPSTGQEGYAPAEELGSPRASFLNCLLNVILADFRRTAARGNGQ